MLTRILKTFVPDRELDLPIFAGPFRGGVFRGRPRDSSRKMLGLYEHELNAWLVATLPKIDDVIDVGANDGYFTFGCAAALQRLGRSGRIIAVEPQTCFTEGLERSARRFAGTGISVDVVACFAGTATSGDSRRLDAIMAPNDPKRRCLIKIDVEGAEVEVLAGAGDWLRPSTAFLIEVHDRKFIEPLTRTLESHGIQARLISQSPLPLLGRENRSVDNWWLVTQPAKAFHAQAGG